MSTSQEQNFLAQGLKLLSHCPLCDLDRPRSQTRMIGRNGDMHVVHVRCTACSHSVLAVLLVSSSGVSSVGMVTDLSFEDANRLKQAESISADDVLRAHDFLGSAEFSSHLAAEAPFAYRRFSPTSDQSPRRKKNPSLSSPS